MRKAAFVLLLLGSFALSGCASGTAFDAPPRELAPFTWRARTTYVVPSQEFPVVDTRAQRDELRRVPHSLDHLNGRG
jgi:hypothetical protein